MDDDELAMRFFGPLFGDGPGTPDTEQDLSLWSKVPDTNDPMNFPISHFMPLLSKRMQRVLSELCIHTVGELSRISTTTLDERGAGPAGRVEIEEGILEPKGLSLPRSDKECD